MAIKIFNPKMLIKKLKEDGRPFKIVSTTLTKRIITDAAEYIYTAESGLKLNELVLIKHVKDYVIKNNIKASVNRSKIQYINKGILKNGVHKTQLFEIDLKSAYWTLAFKKGYISKEIFDRGNNTERISKKARLIALGNLAKRKVNIEFDGVNFLKPDIEYSDDTENIFFSVSQETDAIMNKLKFIAGSDYLFYWVDAIFIRGERAVNEITEYLKEINLDFKVVEIKKIVKTNSYIKVFDDKHEEPRPFIFEPLKIKDLSSIIK